MHSFQTRALRYLPWSSLLAIVLNPLQPRAAHICTKAHYVQTLPGLLGLPGTHKGLTSQGPLPQYTHGVRSSTITSAPPPPAASRAAAPPSPDVRAARASIAQIRTSAAASPASWLRAADTFLCSDVPGPGIYNDVPGHSYVQSCGPWLRATEQT